MPESRRHTANARILVILAAAGLALSALPTAPISATPLTTDPAIEAMIPLGKGQFSGLQLTVDGRRAFTAGEKFVQSVDLSTKKLLRPITVGYNFDFAVSKNGVLLYVARDTESVDIIKVSSGKRRSRTPLDCTPGYLAITPDSKHIFAACPEFGDIYKLNGATGAIEDGRPVVGESSGMAVSANGSRLFVTSVAEDIVVVFDVRSTNDVAVIDVCRGSYDVAPTPDASKVFVLCAEDGTPGSELWELDVASKKRVGKVHLTDVATDMAVSPDGRTLFVAAKGLQMLDANSLATLGTLNVGGRTVHSVAVTSDGKNVVALLTRTATKPSSVVKLKAPVVTAVPAVPAG